MRFSDAWGGRPDLYAAVMAGYGRQLTPAEEEHLAVHAVLDAVSGIQYGAAHRNPELVERGRRTLAASAPRAARDAPGAPAATVPAAASWSAPRSEPHGVTGITHSRRDDSGEGSA